MPELECGQPNQSAFPSTAVRARSSDHYQQMSKQEKTLRCEMWSTWPAAAIVVASGPTTKTQAAGFIPELVAN